MRRRRPRPAVPANRHDGLQQSYSVWHGERRTRVYCDDLFPPEIRRLRELLRERVLPGEAAMKKAPVADQAAFRAAVARAE